MEKIENLQSQFTRRIPETKELNYWERLKILKMHSQERRMERYRIIYTWKILNGKSANCGIKSKFNERLEILCEIPQINKNSNKSIYFILKIFVQFNKKDITINNKVN